MGLNLMYLFTVSIADLQYSTQGTDATKGIVQSSYYSYSVTIEEEQ